MSPVARGPAAPGRDRTFRLADRAAVKEQLPELPNRSPLMANRFFEDRRAVREMKAEAGRAVAPAALTPGTAAPAAADVATPPQIRGGPTAAAPAAVALAPQLGVNFQGISATGWTPPDCTIAVGLRHVMVSVNSSAAIFSKNGARLQQLTLTNWFSDVITAGTRVFDPKLIYDQGTNRWLLVAVGLRDDPPGSWFLISASQSDDPTGGWRNWSLDATLDGVNPSQNWADYPQLGLDGQAVYLTANMFSFGGNFSYVKIRILDKQVLYNGGGLGWTDIWNFDPQAFTLQPAHTFGTPPAQYLVSVVPTNNNRLIAWSLTGPLTGNPVLRRNDLATLAYSMPPNAVQRGGGRTLDTGDTRLQCAVFNARSLWAAHATAFNWGESRNRAAIRWYEIDPATPRLIQQGTYGAAQLYYYYPAIMADSTGNARMVFNRSGQNEYASVRYTGRSVNDPINQLQASAPLKAGTANYSPPGPGETRWGDYSGTALDPSDGSTVWMHGEYAAFSNNWSTWVGSA